MKYRVLTLFIAVFCVAGTAFAQKLEKPFTQWGKEDALKLWNESAWAKTYQSTDGSTAAAAAQVGREQRQTVNRGGSDPRSVARDFGPPPITMRLHSGLPIRQAMVRLQQIANGYDKMSEADKAAFDASKKGFLDCNICKDYYVITITKARDASHSTVEEGIFQGMTMEDLKGNLKLVNDAGEERPIVQFNPPKGPEDMTVFYFKRNDDSGKPLLTTQSKSFQIVFRAEFLDIKNRFTPYVPRTMEFKVNKLVVGENLLF